MEPSFVKFNVVSGAQLAAKDINGKSDPYFLAGFAGADEKFSGEIKKSKYCKTTLNPAWFEKDQSNPDNKEPGIRVEIWDKDFIGKDEFMGYVYIPLSSLKPNLSPQYLKYDVKPRPDKKKDKVSGFINVEVTYYTRKFKEEWEAAEAKRNAEREAAEAKRNAEQKAAAEKRIAERDAKIAELTQSLGETKLDSSVAKKAAAILVDKPGQQLKNGKQVAAVLEELGLIRHFTNMNVLLFNSKDRSAVEIHGNAQISEASARDMMKSEEMSNARADFLMMLFDVNNDGVVDYQELALGLTMQSDADNKERGAFYFDVFDKDKSGTLSRSEIMDLYSVLMRAMFGMVATGVASELMKRSEIRAVMSQSDIKEFVRNFINELKKLQLEVRLTQLIFEKVDKDDSGTITKEEYIAFLDDEDAQAGLHRLVSSTFAQMQAKSGVIAQNEAMAILKRKYRI